MSDLREKLADRFAEWGCSQCDLPRAQWLAMADECIRQMEWVRQSNRRDVFPADFPELTPAPDDWKPE